MSEVKTKRVVAASFRYEADAWNYASSKWKDAEMTAVITMDRNGDWWDVMFSVQAKETPKQAPTPVRKCSTCRWRKAGWTEKRRQYSPVIFGEFREVETTREHKPECHLRAPVSGERWPYISDDDWCGDWEAAPSDGGARLNRDEDPWPDCTPGCPPPEDAA